MTKTSTAQAEALAFIAAVTGQGDDSRVVSGELTEPRRDVASRLAAKGLIEITVKASRHRNADRWTFTRTYTLTEAGRQALSA